MQSKPTIWALFITVLMSVGLTLSDAHARCSPGSDYPLNRGESVSFTPTTSDVDQAPTAVSVAFNVTNATCYNKKNGSITALPSGGTAPYSYLWSNGKTTQVNGNIYAGSYSVTVTDALGITTSGTAVVSQPAQIIAYISCFKTCPNQCNGSASVLVISGGVAPFSYAWSTGSTAATLTGLCAGTYWVTITDANGCKKIVGSQVTTYPSVTLGGNVTNILCNAGCTGAIAQTVSGGGGAPYTYAWSNGATTKNLSNVCAGQYCVTVTSAKGCTASACYTITQSAPPTVVLNPTNPPCLGGLGSITSTVANGVAPYSFIWSNGATTSGISNLTAGNYSVTVTAANGCTAVGSASITVPTSQVSVVATATACSPFTACLGTASAVTSNGTAPYTYAWSNGATGATAGGFCIGVHSVTVTDANQCTATDTISVTPCSPPPCPFQIGINGTVVCGATSATLSANVAGVPAAATVASYEWYVNSVGGTPAGLNATYNAAVPGTYCLRVTFNYQGQQCFAETCTTLMAPTAPTVNITSTNPTCYGKNNGSATAVVSGGTAPYTYLWSNGKTTANNNNLVAGTYSVTVTDANGCTASSTVTLSQPPQIIAYVNCTKTCPNQCTATANLTVSGGTPPYTYMWSNGATTEDLVNLCAGTYWVTITDANGCKKIVGAQVLTYPAVVINSNVTNSVCAGVCNGAVDISVSGGGGAPFTYNWSNGATTQDLAGLCGGVYSVTVTSSKGCTATATYTVNQSTPPTVTLTPTNPPCIGATGDVSSNVSGGTAPYSYLWSNGSTMANLADVLPGSYSVTVTDANGCTASATTNVAPSTFQVTATVTVDSCANQFGCFGIVTASSNGTAPFSYIWSNGVTTQSQTGLCVGTYTVTVTDANGCSGTASGQVVACIPLPCVYDITIGYDADCGDVSTTLSVNIPVGTTPTSYTWFSGSLAGPVVSSGATYEASVPGTYCVYVMFVSPVGLECYASACVTVSAPAAPTVAVTGTNVNCYGKKTGTATANVSGGTAPYTYNWSNGKTTATINQLMAGTYNVTVTDANGCTATGTIIITQPPQLIAYVICTKTCPGQCNATVDVTVTGGTPPYTYMWANGQTTQDLANVCVGTYWVTITDANGCVKILGAQVLSYPAVNITSSVTQPSCVAPCGGSIVLTATGGGGAPYTYLWNNGSTASNLMNLCAGTYSVTVTSSKGCTATATFTLNAVTPQPCTITGNEIICLGETSEFCASAGASYAWSNGATTQCIMVSQAGTYNVTVTSATGCTSTCSRTLVVNPLPVCEITGDLILCPGETTTLTSASASSYAWSNGSTMQSITTGTAGTYSVTVTNAFGCTASCSVTVVVNQTPVCSITGNLSICPGQTTTLTSAAAASYIWSNGATTQSITTGTAGVYSVTITNAEGCTASCSVTVIVNPAPICNITGDLILCSECAPSPAPCQPLRTQTQGGYGQEPSGNNVGTYLYANFDNCFSEVTIGCASGNTLTLTSAQAVSNFLSSGSTPSALPGDLTDPGQAYQNVFAGQLVAATLNVGFDDCDPNFASGSSDLGDMVITTGLFQGWTVDQLIAEANSAIGGCGSSYSFSDLSDALSNVNENYNDGTTDNGFLGCVPNETPCTASTTLTAAPASSYIWSTGATTQSINVSAAGVYSVTVTNAFGCTASCSTTVVVNEPPVCNILGNLSICLGQTTTLTSAPASSYLWSTGATTQSITTGTAGTYGVTITDANGCTSACDVTVVVYDAPVCTITGDNTVCLGETTEFCAAEASSYAWSNGATAQCIEVGTAGTYTVTITDANGCTASCSQTLIVYELPVCNIVGPDTVCNGATAQLCAAAASAYLWSTGQTTQCIDAQSGTYSVTITDANGCTASCQHTVVISPELTVDLTGIDVLCYGDCDGSATANVQGGTAPYTYTWSGTTASGITAIGLCPGSYCVTVTDANGCTASDCVEIDEPTELTPTIILTDVTCYGACDGSATAGANGGTAPYSIVWSNGATIWTATELCAGAYSFTVTDANGCTADGDLGIGQPEPLVLIAGGQNVPCYGDCTGVATAIASGGTAPYTYAWSNNEDAGAVADSLCAGTYYVTATDANGCTAVDTVVIGQPDSLAIVLTNTDVTCYDACDGSATVTITGGSAPYSILWSNGSGFASIDGLCVGEYCVWIQDANGCTAYACITVEQPELLTVTSTATDVDCFNDATGTVTAVANGGTEPYSIVWSNDETTWTISDLTAGIYCFTVTDFNGCTANGCDTVNEPDQLLALIVCPCDLFLCPGDCSFAADVEVFGGTPPYSYNWSNGATTEDLEGLCEGSYCLTITDANGCTFDLCTAPFESADSITAEVTSTDVTCPGECDGSATVTGNGGYGDLTIMWSNDATTWTVEGLCAGEYCFTITDELGCTYSDCVVIEAPAPLSVDTNVTQPTFCVNNCNGSIELIVTGGTAPYSYFWSNGVTGTSVLDNLCAGIYTVTVVDANGCVAPATGILIELLCLPCDLEATVTSTNVTCYGLCDGTAAVTYTGNNVVGTVTYAWSNGATTASVANLCPGTYYVTAMDANECADIDTVVITEPNLLTVTSTATDVDCFNAATGVVTVSVNGGTAPYAIVWSNGGTAFTIDDVVAGTYCYTVTDANGCTASGCETVNEPDQLLGLIVCPCPLTLCPGDCSFAADLEVYGGTPPYSYNWSNGATTQDLEGLCEGMYSVTITDANGCTFDVQTAPFEWADSITAVVTSTDVTCAGACDGSATVTGNGGYGDLTIMWSNSATTWTVEGLCAGEYCFTVTDELGCTYSDCVTIEEGDSLTALATCPEEILCPGDCTASIDLIVFGGTAPYSYNWSNGATTEDLENLCAGVYTVTITDANGCTFEVVRPITQPDAIEVTATATPDSNCEDGVCDGSITVTATGGTGDYTYTWNDGVTTSVNFRDDLCAGTYSITVTDENGCTGVVMEALVDCIPAPCLPLRTQTQGGYGQEPSGNNAGAYLFANFDECFSEVVIGCEPGNTLTLTSAQAVADFVPSGSTPSALPSDLVNPGSSYNNVFAGQLVAATLNVGFDYCDEDFGAGSNNLGDMIITEGPFMGWTVNELIAEANNAIGGCGSSYTFSQLNEALEAVNENYVDGLVDNGFLDCDSVPVCDLEASAASTDVDCFGDCDGTASVTISGGTAPYVVEWSNGITAGTLGGTSLSDLCAGTYSYTVTDENGCEVIGEVTVEGPTELIASAESTDITCYGVEDGTITVSVAGGTAPYAYAWANGSTDAFGTGLGFGTYQITVTDANGCTAVAEATIEEPAQIVATAVATDASVCTGICDGSIDLTVNGGTGSYAFAWSNGANTEDVTGLCPVNYSVTVTDANGCTATTDGGIITVNCLPCDMTASVETTDETCPLACNGSATLTVTGGIGDINVMWSNGATGYSVTDLCPGTYSYTITDGNICEIVDSVTIEAATPIIVDLAVNFNAGICGEACEGFLSVGVFSGTPPFIFAWSNGATTGTVSNLCAGEYTVTITDANMCTLEVGPFTITCEPAPCEPLRTQTMGGWGNTNGEPGQYLIANFDNVFSELVIGCDNTLTLTSAQAVINWLPSTTTPDALPNGNMTNPTNYVNVFAGQLVTATLNVEFDYYDADFGGGSNNLGDMYIQSGTFAGWTVNQLLDTANSAIGGCGSLYTYSELSDALMAINENYVDGIEDNGFLDCEAPVSPSFRVSEATVAAANVVVSAYPNPFATNASIEFTLPVDDANVTLEVYNVTGQKVAQLFNGAVNADQTYNVTFDGAQTTDGMYIYRLVTSNDTFTGQLVRVKP